jgi:hypothetical protein
VDGDSTVNTVDYMRLRLACLASFTLNEAQTSAADLDGSGILDTTDYMRLKAYFLGTYDLCT